MTNNWYDDIVNLHKLIGQYPEPFTPKLINSQTYFLRIDLIKEEISELFKGMETNNFIAIIDGLVDSIVVLIGTAIAYGIKLQPFWDEIHKTNMAKVIPNIVTSPSGKILKPDGWIPPDIKKILVEEIRRSKNATR